MFEGRLTLFKARDCVLSDEIRMEPSEVRPTWEGEKWCEDMRKVHPSLVPGLNAMHKQSDCKRGNLLNQPNPSTVPPSDIATDSLQSLDDCVGHFAGSDSFLAAC